MAEQSAFLTAYDEMQKNKQGQEGFSAPAQMGSVVDTIGQAPAVQSPFSQGAAPNSIEAPIDLMAQPDLAAAPAVQAPQGQVPMLGGFEVRGTGADRFDLGTTEVPETLLSTEYTDPGGNNAAIQAAKSRQTEAQSALQSLESEKQNINQATQEVKAPGILDTITENFAESKLGKFFGGMTTYDVSRGGDVVYGSGNPVFPNLAEKTGTPEYGASDIPAPPVVEMATPESVANLSVNGTNVVTPEAITAAAPAAPAAIQAPELPQQPLPPVMDGSQIPKPGEEGFKFAERGSPQDYFLSQTNDGTTPLSPEQIARGQEYAKQQGLNFDPTTGFSQNTEAPEAQAPQVQAPQGLTTAGGQPLAEFLAGGQKLDAQGRMIDPNVDRSSFEQKSADREARQAARPDFGEAQERAAGTVTDRERRAARGEGMSDADRRDIAKANQRGASAGDIARGDKVAALNGIDRKTGEPLVTGLTVAEKRLAFEKEKYADILAKEAKGIPLTPSELLQREKFEYLKKQDETKEEGIKLENKRRRQIIAQANEPDATSMQKKKGEWEEMEEDMVENNMPEDEIAARRKAFLYGDKFDAFLYGGGTSNKGKGADGVTDATAAGSSEDEYTSVEERYIQNVINKNAGASREDAIKALEAKGHLTKKQ